MSDLDRLRSENAKMRELLREIANYSPAWEPDDRIGYVDVQFDVDTWKELQVLRQEGAFDATGRVAKGGG